MSAGFIDSAQLVSEDFTDFGFIQMSNGSMIRFQITDDPELILSGCEEPVESESWLH